MYVIKRTNTATEDTKRANGEQTGRDRVSLENTVKGRRQWADSRKPIAQTVKQTD